MLTRMVSISRPRDPPASASQSAGITGVRHKLWEKIKSPTPANTWMINKKVKQTYANMEKVWTVWTEGETSYITFYQSLI